MTKVPLPIEAGVLERPVAEATDVRPACTPSLQLASYRSVEWVGILNGRAGATTLLRRLEPRVPIPAGECWVGPASGAGPAATSPDGSGSDLPNFAGRRNSGMLVLIEPAGSSPRGRRTD